MCIHTDGLTVFQRFFFVVLFRDDSRKIHISKNSFIPRSILTKYFMAPFFFLLHPTLSSETRFRFEYFVVQSLGILRTFFSRLAYKFIVQTLMVFRTHYHIPNVHGIWYTVATIKSKGSLFFMVASCNLQPCRDYTIVFRSTKCIKYALNGSI